MAEIIASNYHFWQGDKYENGMTWTFSDEEGQNVEYKDVKTFGFYNSNDITPGDYKLIDPESLERRLSFFILQETGDNEYEKEIRALTRSYRQKAWRVLSISSG